MMPEKTEIIETTEVEKVAFAPEEIMVTDEMPLEDLVIVEEPAPKGPGNYEETQDLGDFMSWITAKMGNLPPHSGKTTAGCERVIAHLKALDKEISRAIARDVDCMLDDQAVEKFRKEIRKMTKKLEKRHKEINDAYDADDDKYATDSSESLVKEAELHCKKCGAKIKDRQAAKAHQEAVHPGENIAFSDYVEPTPAPAPSMVDDKQASACACKTKVAVPEDDTCPTCKIKLWKAAEGIYECIACDEVYEKQITKEAHTAKLTLVMTPFERAISGAIVNGFVSQGKNPEEIYAELKKKYSFTDRDELSIQQILYDMGFPILKDRGHLGDKSEKLNKGMGVEFSTQYSA